MPELKPRWETAASTFAAALFDPEVPAPSFLTSDNGFNDPRRYDVYRNNVVVSLVRAMEANFPSIVRLVGEEFFAAMAQVFVRHHPPSSRLMFSYGAEFPAFLQSFEPVSSYPYLADVARVEQLWREAFHATDAEIIKPNDFAALAPDRLATLRLEKHPATRTLHSPWAAGTIFTANRFPDGPADIDPARGEFVLITRPDLDCHIRILDTASGQFIAGLLEGNTMEAAYSAAVSTSASFDLTANISGLIEWGAFTAIRESQS